MSERQTDHTDGPWVVENPTDRRKPLRIVTVARRPGATSGVEIATVSRLMGKPGEPAHNAALMAEAPTLVEIVNRIVMHVACGETLSPTHPLIIEARAAYVRARTYPR